MLVYNKNAHQHIRHLERTATRAESGCVHETRKLVEEKCTTWVSVVEKRRCHITLGTVNNIPNKIFRNVLYCPGIRLFFEWKGCPVVSCVLYLFSDNVCTN